MAIIYSDRKPIIHLARQHPVATVDSIVAA
jgi:hypothetical protein